MNIGYARVSTAEQNLDLQLDALRAAKCDQTYTDTISGAKADRPGLANAIDHLREGDTLVVWRLDRLGRSLQHLIETVNLLESRNVGFKSVTEQIDTTTPGGKLIFHIFGALAEFERNLIRERTNAGLKAAKARGRLGGRPKAIQKIDPKTLALARHLYEKNEAPNEQLRAMMKVSEATFYRIAKTWKQPTREGPK